MKASSPIRGLTTRSPRRLLALLATISALLVPAAVAWACTPQATVGADKLSYGPGEQMTVEGRDFRSNATITITSDPPGLSATTTSTSAGTFSVQLEAPDEPGLYVLLATSSERFGPALARTTFQVSAPPPAPPRCAIGKLGTGGADTISGTNAGDRIFAFAGNDVVKALAADDCLHGGSGGDRLAGSAGHDSVFAQSGDDRASGGDGNDRVFGGSGNDRVRGGAGRDVVAGGSGRDVLTADSGDDQLYGDSGADRIYAGTGSNRIDAGTGNDYVSARNGSIDTINCGVGRDTARVDRIDRVAGCERVIRG